MAEEESQSKIILAIVGIVMLIAIVVLRSPQKSYESIVGYQTITTDKTFGTACTPREFLVWWEAEPDPHCGEEGWDLIVKGNVLADGLLCTGCWGTFEQYCQSRLKEKGVRLQAQSKCLEKCKSSPETSVLCNSGAFKNYESSKIRDVEPGNTCSERTDYEYYAGGTIKFESTYVRCSGRFTCRCWPSLSVAMVDNEEYTASIGGLA